MSGQFDLRHPWWVAVALVVMVALAAGRALMAGARPSGRRRGLAWILGAVGIGALLAGIDTSAADTLLALAAVLAAWWLAGRTYARGEGPMGPLATAFCRWGRVVALSAVLCLLGRSACNTTVHEFLRPVLAVVLDQSQSMALDDAPASDGEHTQTRAQQANHALAASHDRITALERFYDIRLEAIGPEPRPASNWSIDPTEPASAIAAALRAAGALRDAGGNAPAGVVLISDGGENTADAAVVLQAARELNEQKTSLLVAGVGPAPEATAGITIDPLAVPSRIGRRDRLEVPVVVRVVGMAKRSAEIEWYWDDQSFERREVPIREAQATLRATASASPPRAGLVRLTVRVRVVEPAGTHTASTSRVIDVADQKVRVLALARQPNSETAFVMRALRGDSRLETVMQFRATLDPQTPGIDWSAFDVVLLGDVPLHDQEATSLVETVERDGVGLMLAGGAAMFNGGQYRRQPLRDVSPAAFVLRPIKPGYVRFLPTAAAATHPALRGLVGANSVIAWDELPPIGGGARFGKVKPLAIVLAVDERRQPLLVVQEVGRGRCAAAAWEATWPWALASDEGLRVHRVLWRQLVVWLANRRPAAWVLADEPTYALAAIRSGQKPIRVRAGVTGLPPAEAPHRWDAVLELAPTPGTASPATQPGAGGGRTYPVTLSRRGELWVAELPDAVVGDDWLEPGAFSLRFALRVVAAGGGDRIELAARSGFSIVEIDPEAVEPTANLALLALAARQTARVGGQYLPIDRLPELLDELAAHDVRRPVVRQVRIDITRRYAWWVWGALVAALSLEWAIRRRNNLA